MKDELQTNSILEKAIDEESPGGVLLGIRGGGVSPGSPNPDPISDQKGYFPHPFSDLASKTHTRFQTWQGRNYSIITKIKTLIKIFLKIHIILSLLFFWN